MILQVLPLTHANKLLDHGQVVGGFPSGSPPWLDRHGGSRVVAITADRKSDRRYLVGMPITKGHGNPNWTWEETVVVLSLLQEHYPRVPPEQSSEVTATSELLRGLSIFPESNRTERFRNPAGVYMKLLNLASLHPDRSDRKGLSSSRTDKRVFEQLWDNPEGARQIRDSLISASKDTSEQPAAPRFSDDEALEVGLLERTHRVRERASSLRRRLLASRDGQPGFPCCDACGWSLPRHASGHQLTISALEVHHAVPLAHLGPRRTSLHELVLLCATCHRLIHAMMRQSHVHTVTLDELRAYCDLPDM